MRSIIGFHVIGKRDCPDEYYDVEIRSVSPPLNHGLVLQNVSIASPFLFEANKDIDEVEVVLHHSSSRCRDHFEGSVATVIQINNTLQYKEVCLYRDRNRLPMVDTLTFSALCALLSLVCVFASFIRRRYIVVRRTVVFQSKVTPVSDSPNRDIGDNILTLSKLSPWNSLQVT